jgi:membrane protease YdiL (CAAX protease family)
MTLFWTFVIFFIFAFAQVAGMVIAAMLSGIGPECMEVITSGNEDLLASFTYDNDLIWPSALSSALIGSLLIFIVIKMKKGLSIVDYLNLRNVTLPVWGIWLLVMVVLSFILEYFAVNFEDFQTPFMEDVVLNSKNIPMLFLSVGILAPIFEELLFRGFVFKGLERSFLGGHGTVWLTAIAFAAIHMQYSWGVILLIIPMGVALGYSRMFSGSLLVPIFLHILNNCLAIGLVLQSGSVETSF